MYLGDVDGEETPRCDAQQRVKRCEEMSMYFPGRRGVPTARLTRTGYTRSLDAGRIGLTTLQPVAASAAAVTAEGGKDGSSSVQTNFLPPTRCCIVRAVATAATELR